MLAPQSLYAASKLFCEHLAGIVTKTGGTSYAISRYGHIFGAGEAAYRKLIPEAIRRLLAGVSPLLYGDGSAERDFLYVDDVVEATLRAAVAPVSELGPVNFVRGE